MIHISISWLRRILILGGSLLFVFALLHVLLITVWRGNSRLPPSGTFRKPFGAIPLRPIAGATWLKLFS